MTATVTISLPMPPSANRIWRAGRRRVYRSAAYLRWLRSAGWELKTQRPTPFPAGLSIGITIRAGKPDKRRRDADNIAKAICDLLQAHAVIDNDVNVGDLRIVWDDSIAAGRVQVEAWAIERRAA